MKQNSRRSFLRNFTIMGAAASLPKFKFGENRNKEQPIKWPLGTKVLFQGDSITDGGRGRNLDWNHVLGQDYAYLIASRLWYDNIDKQLQFFNRGISGNRVTDLLNRWEKDALEIKPDILNILVGVNDSLAAISGDKSFTIATYETDYRHLLNITQKALPGTKIVICEPFILPVGKVKEHWQDWQKEVKPRQEVARKLAKEFDAVFIPLQDHFSQALQKAPADYWIWDGVHPMPAGHEMIARVWIKAIGE
jgi:lysophospholipase L1-like esterase